MTDRSDAQRIGEEGHRLAMYQIAQNPNWIARDLGQDYGIDAEAELACDGVRGELLKLQFKTSLNVDRKEDHVEFTIERPLIDYADSCRYPVILVRVDISAARSWYLWIQKWLLDRKASNLPIHDQASFTVWVSESQNLITGLDMDLKSIAQWRGETQLVLSLLDALRAATATRKAEVIKSLVMVIVQVAPTIANASLDILLAEAIRLGGDLRGTHDGLVISQQLFSLIRQFGDRASLRTVDLLVRRDDTYSRTGLSGLGILYDENFDRMKSLGLVKHFLDADLPHVAYYCAMRERDGQLKDLDYIGGPGDFVFAGLKFCCPPDYFFMNTWANRGASAILDFLVRVDEPAVTVPESDK